MGIVYHAIDPNIGRPVAIKTIHLGAGRTEEEQDRLRERLFREARSAGILSHPGIVTIYDVEQHGEVAYIAMEYVDGPTLDQLLSQEEALSAERLFSILGQTAVALDYAHQKGIIHRDIKPANIMIAGGGTAKITDFGIAKITASEQFTMTGSIVGTPHYMSPEQVQGQPVDGRSDQFSLAVIAFEMLTGEKPYTGEHLTTVVYKIVAEEPPPPHRLNPSLSGAIEAVLRKGLAKKADARYRNCQEFVDALEKACAGSRGWKAMPRGGSLSAPTIADAARPTATMPSARRPSAGESTNTPAPARRKPGFLPFLAAILVAALLLALIGWQADPSFPQKIQGVAQRAQAMLHIGQGAEQPGIASQQEPANPGITPAASQPQPPKAEEKAPVAVVPPAPAPPSPADVKPSPMQPKEAAAPATSQSAAAKRQAVPEEPPARVASRPVPDTGPGMSRTRSISVTSSPGGATATLDGRPEMACTTPCSLAASPGRHSIAVTLQGYQVEHRDVEVGTGPLEIPSVVLRASVGTLMISTEPAGATVLVNGRKIPETTPAQLPLAPGTYEITVEKDGRQSTNNVEIRTGALTTLKILLVQ
jgi:Protein kinase domain/PEGA domain